MKPSGMLDAAIEGAARELIMLAVERLEELRKLYGFDWSFYDIQQTVGILLTMDVVQRASCPSLIILDRLKG